MFLPTLPQRSVTQVLSELREQWKDRPSWSRCLAPTRSKARGRQKKTFNNEGQRVKRCTRGRQAGWDRACHLLGISREAVSKNIAGGGNASHGQDYNTSVCTRVQQNCRKVGKCLAKAPHDTHTHPQGSNRTDRHGAPSQRLPGGYRYSGPWFLLQVPYIHRQDWR